MMLSDTCVLNLCKEVKMKDISLTKKQKVIKLFFSGLSYDEIAVEVGIAKGSVVKYY